MKLTKKQYKILTQWISDNLIMVNSYNNDIQSGTLKGSFEHSHVGFYVDLETFNNVLLDCGYTPRSFETLYWDIKVSKKSPAITQYIGMH